jgi:tight adherence protein B
VTDGWVLAGSSAAVGGVVALGWGPLVASMRGGDDGTARALRDEMRAAGMDPAVLPGYLLAWRGAALGLVAVLWGGLGMAPVGVVLAGITYQAAPWWVRGRIRAYRRRVNEQVAGVARNLGGQVRVGLPLNDALAVVAADTATPLGTHLRQTALQIAQGEGVRVALADLKARVRVEAVTSMTVALQVVDERGGPLADVLDRIAFTAEELARVERKREADTAAGRLMIGVMAAFPGGFLAFVAVLDPALVARMFDTTLGHYVLAVVALLVYASVRWGSRILSRVE